MKTFAPFALLVVSFLFSSTPAFAVHATNGGSFTLSTTPTQFSSTLGNVQKITFRVIPGGSGKVWIGNSSLNTSTNAGAFKILFPNTSGGLSDEYTVEDKSSADGINTALFYIAGGVSGEKILWEAYSTGVTASTFLSPMISGPYAGNDWHNLKILYTPVPTTVAIVSLAMVPGQTGKVHYGYIAIDSECASNVTYHFKVLWPNSSGTNITDFTQTTSPDGSNGIRLDRLSACSEVSGEAPLLTVWVRS